jgi:putative membrane protein insertion efficiency factor
MFWSDLEPFVPLKRQWNLRPATAMNKVKSTGLGGLPRLAGRALVQFYRYALSPLLGPRCRHVPTCSDYADEAIGRFGLWAGGWMTLARILRCHPWGTSGLDMVPDRLPGRVPWYLPWRYGRWRGVNEKPGS